MLLSFFVLCTEITAQGVKRGGGGHIRFTLCPLDLNLPPKHAAAKAKVSARWRWKVSGKLSENGEHSHDQ